MARKVSKNQRTSRGGQKVAMAKVIVSEKKSNGQFRSRDKVMLLEDVQEAVRSARA